MFQQKLFRGILLGVLMAAFSAVAQDTGPAPKIRHLNGPAVARLGAAGHIQLPEADIFYDGDTTRQLLKASGEPISGQEVGTIISTNEDWSVMFDFSDVGYVKDDEKNNLNADKILADIKEGTAEANKERIKNGSPPLEVVGWEQPPHYDEATHNLTWAVRCTAEGHPLLNYNTRILGRQGVMEVVLICEPNQLPTTLPTYSSLLAGYSFEAGQTYAEYRPGDKLAKYGLAALVVGGAGVAAAKLGLLAWVAVLFKKAWKLIAVAVAAIATSIKKFWAKITGRKSGT